MLKRVIIFLRDKTPLYILKKVKDIDHSCCSDCEKEVLDFDAIKDEFTRSLGIREDRKLCSVDGVVFNKRDNSIYIFDMNRYNPMGALSLEDYISKELKDMPKKIYDTLYLLTAILGYYKIDQSLYFFLLHPLQIRIKPFLLVNVKKSEDMVGLRLALQNELNISLSNRIEKNISLINCEEFEKALS